MLRVELAPFERLHIGECVLTNSHMRLAFSVDGVVPIMRGRDVLAPENAIEPLAKLYFYIQQTYLESNQERYAKTYNPLLTSLRNTGLVNSDHLGQISNHVAQRDYYKALKLLKRLISQDLFAAEPIKARNYRPREYLERGQRP